MSVKYFIDTNILVHSFDRTSNKKAKAEEIIQNALESGLGIISTQVVQEFFNVATQKFLVKMTRIDAIDYLHKVMNPLCQVFPTIDYYALSLELKEETGYSFYDSLILSAAINSESKILFSEDFQDGQNVRGVKIINPFLNERK
jgi:predicted nucleic acid-binding protein